MDDFPRLSDAYVANILIYLLRLCMKSVIEAKAAHTSHFVAKIKMESSIGVFLGVLTGGDLVGILLEGIPCGKAQTSEEMRVGFKSLCRP